MGYVTLCFFVLFLSFFDLDLILSPETCLEGYLLLDVSRRSVVFLEREIVTQKSIREVMFSECSCFIENPIRVARHVAVKL